MNTIVAIVRSGEFQSEVVSTLQGKGMVVRTALAASMLAVCPLRIYLKQDVLITNRETVAFLFVTDWNRNMESTFRRIRDFFATFHHTFIIMIGEMVHWNALEAIQ